MTVEESLKELDDSIALLEALSKMSVPEGKEAAAEWLQSEAFDKTVGKISGMAYRKNDRKKDRQRIVPISAVLSALSELEEGMVKAAVLGPWKSGIAAVSGPIKSAQRAASFIEGLAETQWSQLLADVKTAAAGWEKTKGTIMERVSQYAGPFADKAKELAGKAADTLEDPRIIATGLLIAFAGVMTAASIKKNLKAVAKAKDDAAEKVRSRAFPQARVARLRVHRRTRS